MKRCIGGYSLCASLKPPRIQPVRAGYERKKSTVGKGVVDVHTLRSVLRTNVCPQSSLYLFRLGTVSDLCDVFGVGLDGHPLSNTTCVYKYGLTKDLGRRALQHQVTYGRIPGVELGLKCHVAVSPMHLANAERDLEHMLTSIV